MGVINLQPLLIGSTVRLRPLEDKDFDSLYESASDPQIWALHPDSERYQRDIFHKRFFESALASGGALVIEEVDSGRIIGSSRYYEWDAESREISIGYTFIASEHWGNGVNSEVKRLMLEHIFQWASVVWFHIGKINIRSRRAVEKLGAIFSYEKERELEGKSYIQQYYKLKRSAFLVSEK
ncbi:N-acetyltransferase [Leucothrix sargassi]|nr:N-acetyltransferase [Leucothrix sargassi]